MAGTNTKVDVERSRTDTSLSDERGKTDAELSRSRQAIEGGADQAVETARAQADATLDKARDAADAKLLDTEAVPRAVTRELKAERREEDEALAKERATIDLKLNQERRARQRAIVELLQLERATTDESLTSERLHSDQAVQSRDQFLAMVSHDLRTLLGGVSLTAAVLKRQGQEGSMPRVEREADRLRGFVARMNHLIGDLVDVASIEVGKLSVAPQADDARKLIRETMEAFQAPAAERGTSLNADVDGQSILATFDEERILQVLANLVSNAIKFTPEGGHIAIRVEPVGDEVQFSVTDSGRGIASDELKEVFEQFWQAPQRERRVPGLGLGLYISKCIVEAHGGRIWAENNASGQGATIKFTLPGAATSSA